MEGRTYPREWFETTRGCREPIARTFYGETEHTLQELPRGGRKRYTKKVTSYSQWHPTLEEAQAVVDAQNAEQAERRRKNRIRDAAPELLAAAKLALEVAENHINNEFGPAMRRDRLAELQPVRDAITKAEGKN